MSKNVTGEYEKDRDSLVLVLSKFREAYDDFDVAPGADESAELASWSQALYGLCSACEDEYGIQRSQRLIESAWVEVKS